VLPVVQRLLWTEECGRLDAGNLQRCIHLPDVLVGRGAVPTLIVPAPAQPWTGPKSTQAHGDMKKSTTHYVDPQVKKGQILQLIIPHYTPE
jgi:hypothetical protein